MPRRTKAEIAADKAEKAAKAADKAAKAADRLFEANLRAHRRSKVTDEQRAAKAADKIFEANLKTHRLSKLTAAELEARATKIQQALDKRRATISAKKGLNIAEKVVAAAIPVAKKARTQKQIDATAALIEFNRKRRGGGAAAPRVATGVQKTVDKNGRKRTQKQIDATAALIEFNRKKRERK